MARLRAAEWGDQRRSPLRLSRKPDSKIAAECSECIHGPASVSISGTHPLMIPTAVAVLLSPGQLSQLTHRGLPVVLHSIGAATNL